ncbi:MAG: hypothetical protein D6813_10630 [Calditrichaeota bacterium]|nr:MAG: hypothetical protein D6813_10630 [Calditrichota bacterium]
MKWVFFTGFVILFLIRPSFAATADSVKIHPLQPQAESVSIYEISFVTTEELQPKAQIVVIFPAEFDLSKVKIANSFTINGGFNVEVQGNRVVLKRTGQGDTIPAGKKVEVLFANVKNPPDRSYSVEVGIVNENNINTQFKKLNVLIEPKRKVIPVKD